MKSFEDLGVAPEIAEALAAEGIEVPTPLQESAIPVVRKGNNLILEAGPGSGLLLAWAAGLVDRLEAGGTQPRALVVCSSSEVADRLAESTARLASGLGHRIAALGSPWVLAERADLLFASLPDTLTALAGGVLAPEALEAVVVDQAQLIEESAGLKELERLFEYVPSGAQRILTALPMSEGVTDLSLRHFKRTVTLPAPEGGAPARGAVRFRIVPEPREAGTRRIVQEVLAEGARHVLVYCRTEDRAADLADDLTLHGFAAGAPGDAAVPVWLAVDALGAREAVSDTSGVVVVSCDAPADPDALDRRHSLTDEGVVVVLPREVAHLRRLGKRTGYDTVPFPPPRTAPDPMARLRATLSEAIEEEDIAPYLAAIEPLLETHDPIEVAAAAVALLRRSEPASGGAPAGSAAPSPRAGPGGPASVPSWAKLFLSVGERDGLRKGDLVGAITGEAGVSGDAVGRIEIRESHSLVEVHDTVASKVIGALNGTTIKGRSVRADFDRPRKGPPRRSRPQG